MNNDENKKELSAEEIIEAEKPETEKIEINSKSEVKDYKTNSDGQNSKKKKTKSPKAPRQKMSKARFNHTIGALVITAVVLVATILLNVVVSLMSDKLPGMSIDLTSKGAFQLSETSIKLAQNVKKDLKITFLDDKQSYRSKASSNTYYAQVMAIAEVI